MVYLQSLLIFILSALLLHAWWRLYRTRIIAWWKRQKDSLPRRWQPKSPDDCPYCRTGINILPNPIHRKVQPWNTRKSSRGRRKSIPTHGFACLNPSCEYFGITDETIHALVGNGKNGQHHNIQNLKCQCCGKAFTSRKGTPLYYLKTSEHTIEMVLWFLAEGIDQSVMTRYTKHCDATIARWLTRMGQHTAAWHNRLFHNLSFGLIQMDELYARVRNHQKSRWVWLAIDPITKVIPSLHLGGRTSGDAYALVHDLTSRLQDGCIPAFTTDGLRSYFYALTAHFGDWHRPERARKDHWKASDDLLHGQLIKRKTRRSFYSLTRMAWGNRQQLTSILRQHGLTHLIQTAFIERVNLTFRQSVAPLTRKTWALPLSEQHLLIHLEWFRFYYHFVRFHESLRESVPGLKRRYQQRTPAMALGLTDHIWTVGDILRTPIIPTL